MCDQGHDDCASNPCDNGGQCYDGPGSFLCLCPSGKAGPTCSREQLCADGKWETLVIKKLFMEFGTGNQVMVMVVPQHLYYLAIEIAFMTS